MNIITVNNFTAHKQKTNPFQGKVLKFKTPAFGAITAADTSEKRPLVIISDLWWPHTSGVVVSTANIAKSLKNKGYHVKVISPDGITDNFDEKCPKSNDGSCFKYIKSDLLYGGDLHFCIDIGNKNKEKLRKMLVKLKPIAIYNTTEGSLGLHLNKILENKDIPYMTSYLTNWTDYVNKRVKICSNFVRIEVSQFLKNFHNKPSKVMVTTPTMKKELLKIGIKRDKPDNIVIIPRGVDLNLFKPDLRDEKFTFVDSQNSRKTASRKGMKVIIGYVGRVSVEKNLDELLELTKTKDKKINNGNYKIVIIGKPTDDEYLNNLRIKYPNAIFTGPKSGEELAKHYANLDVFAFPSTVDTFGVVQLEALACGTPVAAHDVQGPKDIIGGKNVGSLNEDLSQAISNLLNQDQDLLRKNCREFVEKNYSWDKTADLIAANLDKIDEKKLSNL